mgnify:CR=1 FL=1
MLLERRIPDVVCTDELPVRLAAEIDFLAGRTGRWCDLSDQHPPALSARALALAGRHLEASTALGRVDVESSALVDIAAAAWAASRVGGPTVPLLLARLDRGGPEFVEDQFPAGPRRLYTGVLHAAQGELPTAIAELTAAAAVGDARAPLWGALCRLELGRVLRTVEALPVADAAPSAPVLAAARTYFLAGGYRSLAARVEAASSSTTAVIDQGRPGSIGFGVQPASGIRSTKGLLALAHLVENEHRVVSAAELAMVVDGGDPASVAALTAEALASRATDDEVRQSGEYIDSIRAVLFDDTTRSRMTKLLRRTIANLSQVHQLAARHLDASVVTGYGCRYRPRGAPVTWRIGSPR